jgi:hypothetical protein
MDLSATSGFARIAYLLSFLALGEEAITDQRAAAARRLRSIASKNCACTDRVSGLSPVEKHG